MRFPWRDIYDFNAYSKSRGACIIAVYLFILAFIGMTIYFVRTKYEFTFFLFSLLISGLTFIFAFIFIVIPASIVALPDSPSDDQVEVVEEIDLIALQDNLTIKGSIFVLSGYIDEELQYFYLYDNGYGMQYDNIKVKDCYIKYTDEASRVVKWTLSNKSNMINRLFCTYKTYYTFYVPEDSMIENTYNIDLT